MTTEYLLLKYTHSCFNFRLKLVSTRCQTKFSPFIFVGFIYICTYRTCPSHRDRYVVGLLFTLATFVSLAFSPQPSLLVVHSSELGLHVGVS